MVQPLGDPKCKTADDITDGDPDARAAVIELLREGEATISDAARLAGVDRQLVYYWAKVEKIDVEAVRNARLAKRWRAKMAKQKGRATPKRLSKAEQRTEAEILVRKFNEKLRARRV